MKFGIESHHTDADYADLLTAVQGEFRAALARGPLFQTAAKGLWEAYFEAIYSGDRQYHNCRSCRQFLDTVGGLVTIDEDGNTRSALWDFRGVPDIYAESVRRLAARTRRAPVTGPFLSTVPTLGSPEKNGWDHLSVTGCPVVHNAYPATAAAKEKFATLKRALGEIRPATLQQAVRLLETGDLARAEKFIEPVKFLRRLQDRPSDRRGDNLLWRAVATAPEGFCHPRSGMTGLLCEMIADGKGFAFIRDVWTREVDPLAYQRPVAPPSVGNIAAAEKVFETLGLGPALERRYARLDEVLDHAIWASKAEKTEPRGGLFGHLRAAAPAPAVTIGVPQRTMTWSKFRSTVLPTADRIEVANPAIGNGAYIALTTAVNPLPESLWKWANDVAWYVRHGVSSASDWKLRAGEWSAVTAIVPLPTMWGPDPMPYISEGDVLILEGAADQRVQGAAIFPECLRADLHGVRSTIEAFSNASMVTGKEDASACGWDMRAGFAKGMLRVLADGAWSVIHIDRWD